MATQVTPIFSPAERYACVDRALWTKVGVEPRNVLAEVLPASSQFTNKADNKQYAIEFYAKLPDGLFQDALNMLNENMRAHYIESGWGWNEKKKKRELKDDEARFLVIRDVEDQSMVAFTHFRFLVEDLCTVLYCYELQVRKDRSRLNLGKRLMTILELTGRKFQMEFLMLTVITRNDAARNFYAKLGYAVDETSPQMDLEEDNIENVPYEILSKRLIAKPQKA